MRIEADSISEQTHRVLVTVNLFTILDALVFVHFHFFFAASFRRTCPRCICLYKKSISRSRSHVCVSMFTRLFTNIYFRDSFVSFLIVSLPSLVSHCLSLCFCFCFCLCFCFCFQTSFVSHPLPSTVSPILSLSFFACNGHTRVSAGLNVVLYSVVPEMTVAFISSRTRLSSLSSFFSFSFVIIHHFDCRSMN